MPISRQTRGVKASIAADPLYSHTLLLASDLQQSILAELDRSGPNKLSYTAYGSQSSQLPVGARLGFNGQLKEQTTDWYHLGNGHRVYDPVLMRFHSPDRLSPFGKGGLNAYAYCSGSPINRIDPSGKNWINLLSTAIGTGLNLTFAAAAVNRSARALAFRASTDLVTRIGNVGSFWGGVTGIPSRLVGLPDAIRAVIPASSTTLSSIGGGMVSQVLTTGGAILQNVVMARSWWRQAGVNGMHRGRLLGNAVLEASGARLGVQVVTTTRDWAVQLTGVLRRRVQRLSARTQPDIPMTEIVIQSGEIRRS